MSKRYRITAEPYYTNSRGRQSYADQGYVSPPTEGDEFVVESGRKPDPDGDVFGTLVRTGTRWHVAKAILERIDKPAKVTKAKPSIRPEVLTDLLLEVNPDRHTRAARVGIDSFVALAVQRSAE